MVIKIFCMVEEINMFFGIDIFIFEVYIFILVWNKWLEIFENWIYYNSIWILFLFKFKKWCVDLFV